MTEFQCNECGAAGGEPCQRTTEPAASMTPVMANVYWDRVQSVICEARWAEWKEMEVKIINEYRLNMLEREHRTLLKNHMNEFLNLDGTSKSSGQAPSAVAAEWKPQD